MLLALADAHLIINRFRHTAHSHKDLIVISIGMASNSALCAAVNEKIVEENKIMRILCLALLILSFGTELCATTLQTKPAFLKLRWNGKASIESENIPWSTPKDISAEEIVQKILKYRCDPVYIICDKGAPQRPNRADVVKAKEVQEKLRAAHIQVSKIIEASSAATAPGYDWRIFLPEYK